MDTLAGGIGYPTRRSPAFSRFGTACSSSIRQASACHCQKGGQAGGIEVSFAPVNPMRINFRYIPWSLGTPEYILLKAGLFQAEDGSPTDRLTRLLRPLKDVPEELLPILVCMAEMCALDLGYAIVTEARRTRLVADLRKLSLRHEAIGDLFVLVGKGAAKAAEDRRKQPAALPL